MSVASVTRPRPEWFYWITILFSQTLGTALGDWVAGEDGGGLNVSRLVASLILAAFIFGCIALIPQRAAKASDTA